MKNLFLTLAIISPLLGCAVNDTTSAEQSKKAPVFSNSELAKLPTMAFPPKNSSKAEEYAFMQNQLLSFPHVKKQKTDCVASGKKFVLKANETIVDGKVNTDYSFQCE